jgi:DNA-binding response OmpR family regulator
VHVLIIEDEPSVASGVSRALIGDGHTVEVERDGILGHDAALERDFDLIILDVMLPGMNGYRICRSVRDHGRTTAILMLSAKSGEWDIAEGLDTGADDYLVKPFSTVELLARVRARARRHGSSYTLRHGDLRLDPDLQRCWRGDAEIELTRRESQLLVALFDQSGGVLSKRDLLQSAWSDGQTTDENVVEVYVGRLRRKLDVPFGTDDIETVRGVGYRLRPRPVER